MSKAVRYEVTLRGIGWAEAVDPDPIPVDMLAPTHTMVVRATSEDHAVDLVMTALTRSTGFKIRWCTAAYVHEV
jgi:hypothetical protein